MLRKVLRLQWIFRVNWTLTRTGKAAVGPASHSSVYDIYTQNEINWWTWTLPTTCSCITDETWDEEKERESRNARRIPQRMMQVTCLSNSHETKPDTCDNSMRFLGEKSLGLVSQATPFPVRTEIRGDIRWPHTCKWSSCHTQSNITTSNESLC